MSLGSTRAGADALTEKVIEKLAAVLVRMKPVFDIGRQTGVNVTVVKFTVKDEEDLV